MPWSLTKLRLRAAVLDLLPLPMALAGAAIIGVALQSAASAAVSALIFHTPRLGLKLREQSALRLFAQQVPRVALLAVSLIWLPEVAAAAGWRLGEAPPMRDLWLALGLVVAGYALLFAMLHALLRRGHFAARVALVGTPAAVSAVKSRLRETRFPMFRILGVFDDTKPQEMGQLLDLGQREWLDAIVLARQTRLQGCPSALRHQLRHLSAPVALMYPTRMQSGWLQVDDFDLATFTRVAAAFGQSRFGFVVTPNADHLVRLHEDETFRDNYAKADFVLFDSRFLARWLHWTRRQALRVCPGSDLTAALFNEVVAAGDRLVVIGGTLEQAQQLRNRYGLRDLQQLVPPMGFIHDPEETAACLEFIEHHSPFRFCLLAVGAPQQERIAALLKERGMARGLALCVGASLNFLTGDETRAPLWMQRAGLEWFHRLVKEPRRLAARYLWRGPRVFGILSRQRIGLRRRFFTVTTPARDARPHRTDTVVPANRRRTG